MSEQRNADANRVLRAVGKLDMRLEEIADRRTQGLENVDGVRGKRFKRFVEAHRAAG